MDSYQPSFNFSYQPQVFAIDFKLLSYLSNDTCLVINSGHSIFKDYTH